MSQEKLTIVQLEARNVTNLKAVRITPDRKVVVLTGPNEAGKSNILDVIQSLIEGLKINMPIRQGEERADAAIDLGDIKIRKRWTDKGEGLEVYRIVDGKKQTYSSPQTFLNELTGKMIDPMKLYSLMKNDTKKFRDTLADIVGLDLTDLNKEEIEVREQRKLINDKIRDAVAQLKEMTAPDPQTPEEEIKFKTELEKVNNLRERYNNYHDVIKMKREMQASHSKKIKDLNELKTRIEELQKEYNIGIENLDRHEKQIEELKIPEIVTDEEMTAAEAEIEKLEERNVEIREAKRYRQKVKESQKYQKQSDAFSEKISCIQQDKQTRIASCAFPVEGLSLTEDNVLFEGKPVSVASSGRQIRIFTKMAIAMSKHVKVLLIRDGSLLDNTAFGEICKIAEDEGYQIWLEKVDESGKVGVFIENGEVTALNGEPVNKELEGFPA